MSLFRQAVLRSRILHTLSTHGLILAVGSGWHNDVSQNRLMLSVPERNAHGLPTSGLTLPLASHPKTGKRLMDNLDLSALPYIFYALKA